MSDARWVCGVLAACLAVAAVIVGGVLWVSVLVGRSACETRADEMNRDYRYGLMAGCRVETDDGQFVPLDNLRITNEENA